MIAFASREPRETREFLDHLCRLSLEGMLVDGWKRHPGGNHPDGWGVAWRFRGETRLLRGALPASADPRLPEASVRTDRFVGHVRFASNRSSVSAGNAHPFLSGGLALAHNGTFFGAIGKEGERRGISDSLVFLETLAPRVREGTLDEIAQLLRELLSDRALVGEYTAANRLLLREDDLFAFHRSRKDPGYYSLFVKREEGRVVASSERLDGGEWIPLREGELVELSAPSREPRLLDLP